MTDLHAPTVTTLAAGVLGLIFAVLSGQVVAGRLSGKVMIGAGSEDTTNPLFIAVRSQANFAEYVPLALLLIGLIELRTGATLLVEGLAGALVIARILHPIGLRLPAPNPFRAGGFILTVTVLAVASIRALLVVLG
jgi:uncharacterized membrane protein YecN with MAPEG domain